MQTRLVAEISKWVTTLEKGLENETFGQLLEALSAYETISNGVLNSEKLLNANSIGISGNGNGINKQEEKQRNQTVRQIIVKTHLVLNARIIHIKKTLQMSVDKKYNSDILPVPTVDELGIIANLLRHIKDGKFVRDEDFPIDVGNYNIFSDNDSYLLAIVGMITGYRGGSLLPPPNNATGSINIVISIDNINVECAAVLIQPYITISVINANGERLESSQDTPVSREKRGQTCVCIDSVVNIQTPKQKLPEGMAICFELKHTAQPNGIFSYFFDSKPKEETVAWGFIEMDDLLKEGPIATELYAPPFDKMRDISKLTLLSEGDFYLNLNIKTVKSVIAKSSLTSQQSMSEINRHHHRDSNLNSNTTSAIMNHENSKSSSSSSSSSSEGKKATVSSEKFFDELEELMTHNFISQEEALILLQQKKMLQAGISPDGIPNDDKLVTFGKVKTVTSPTSSPSTFTAKVSPV